MSQPNDDFDPEKYKVKTSGIDANDDFDPEQYKASSTSLETKPKFDKANFAKIMIGMMSGNPAALGESAIKASAKKIPESLSHGLNLLFRAKGAPEHPLRDVGGAALDIATGIPNMILGAPQAAGEVGLIPQGMGEKVPRVPSLSHEGENDTDKLLRALLGQAPAIYGGVKAGPTMARGAVKTISGIPSRVMGKKNPILEAKGSALENEIEAQSQEVEKAKQEAREQEKIHKQTAREAKRRLNLTDADAMEYALNKQKEDISAAKEKQNELTENLQTIEPQPEEPQAPEERTITPPAERDINAPEIPQVSAPEAPPKTSYEHAISAEKAADEALKVEDMVQKAKEHYENVSKIDQEANKPIASYLNLGKAHHVHVGEYIKGKFKEIGDDLKSDYKAKVKEVKESGIEVPSDKIYRPKKSKNEFVKSIIEELPKKSEVKASTVMSRYKDLKREIYNLGQRAKFTESARERDSIFEALPELRKVSASFKSILDESLGEHAEDFKKLNERYSDYYDLKENRTRKAATKTGKLSKSMADQLSGSEIGQELLRDIVKENPEMIKHIVGQQYKKPSSVHNPNEILEEYTKELPQLNDMLEGKKASEEMKRRAKEHLENVKQQQEKAKRNYTRLSNAAVRAGREESRSYKEYAEKKRSYDKVISSYERDKRQYEKDLKDQARERKEYESQLSAAEKEKLSYKADKEKYDKQVKDRELKIKKAEKVIDDHKRSIEKMESRSELLEDQMKKVREQANRKDIKLEQKFKEEQKFSKLKKELSGLNREISDSTTGLHKAIFIAKTIYKVGIKFKRFI